MPPVSIWERLAALPVRIESYDLTGHDREFGEFTRGSTVVHMHGEKQEGIGEDVVYTVLDHIAHRDAGPIHDFTGAETLGEICALIGTLDLFPGAAPEYPASRHYRRWAYESAALDLALRQNRLALWEVVERDPSPLRFVCSTRLGGFGEDAPPSDTEPIRKRLERYPGLEFKLDPENDWDEELIEEIKDLATVRVLDLKGMYVGTPVDVDTDPNLYRAVAEAFPDAYLEDPDLNAETTKVLEPRHGPGHLGRAASLARRRQGARDQGDQLEAVSVRLAPGAALDLRVLRRRTGSRSTAAARARSSAAAGRPSTWPRSSTPTRRTTSRPRASTIPPFPAGMPSSPMDPMPSETGFRWAEPTG